MTPYTQVLAQNKITDMLRDITTMDDTGNAAKVIDSYEASNPEDREYIQEVRNTLCDITFEVFALTRLGAEAKIPFKKNELV
jgi:hypothetical protein